MMVDNKKSGYRWYILVLAAGGNMLMGLLAMCMPVLFPEIAGELGLSLVQIGTVWSMVNLAGLFTTLPGGSLVDRFGVKRTVGVSCILTGLAGALRGVAGGFFSLAATMFLVGLLSAAIVPCIHKASAEWFPKEQLGMANGIVMVGVGIGQTVGAMISATVLSPILPGGWRGVVVMYGIVAIVIGILWFLTRNPQPMAGAGEEHAAVPMRQALAKVLRIKDLWIIGLSSGGMMGCYQGSLGYMALYLQGLGWSTTSSSAIIAATGAAAMVAAIPIAMLSDKLGTRKAVMMTAALVTAAAFAVLPMLSGTAVWVAMIIGGIPVTGYLGLMVTMGAEAKGVGIYAGIGMSVILTLFRIGGIIAPPLGNSLASISAGAPFYLWSAMAVLTTVGLSFVTDTGRRAKKSTP